MFFTRKKKEEKSSNSNDYAVFSFIDDLINEGKTKTDIKEFINSYIEACPVFTATKLIADAISSINIVLRDKKTGDFIYNHKALNLLNNPNPFIDGQLFLNELASYYILTGNSYINIIGDKEPIEINNIKPQDIQIIPYNDGYAGQYSYSSFNSSSTYERKSNKKFFDKNNNEIIHLRSFNPKYSSTNLTGLSLFAGCELEINQYILVSLHNIALLRNGARPSGLLTYKGSNILTKEQADLVKETIKSKLSGAKNAGEVPFLGGDFSWQALSESIKDMDFGNLKNMIEQSIYKAVKIPLPLVNADNMTFSNLNSSTYIFYDNAVLPILKRILKFLSTNLLSRYKDAVNLEFYFDEASIECLQARKFENAKILGQIGVLSDNEIRSIIGYEAVNGGDAIYKPQNLIQVGQDTYIENNRNEPSTKSEKSEFIRIMKKQQSQDGGRFYSDEYIELKATEFYGD